MGHIKDIANQSKIQTFPSATFEIQGEVPTSQCSEAKLEGDNGSIEELGAFLFDFEKFIGWNLVGKFLTIISPPVPIPTQQITANDNDFVFVTDLMEVNSNDAVYYIHNGGSLILTRNLESFARFIAAAGYPYTIKSAKLFTTMPSNLLQNACTILFDPLT